MIKREGPDLNWVADLIGPHSVMEAVLVPAFVDLDTLPRQVKLFPRSVFVESGSGYVVLKIDSDSGQLQLEESQALVIPPTLQSEPSVEPVFADLSPNYLNGAYPVRCLGVTLYFDTDSSASANRFRAVGFRLDEDRTLLFDPFWPSGIRIGGEFEELRLRDEISHGSFAELAI